MHLRRALEPPRGTPPYDRRHAAAALRASSTMPRRATFGADVLDDGPPARPPAGLPQQLARLFNDALQRTYAVVGAASAMNSSKHLPPSISRASVAPHGDLHWIGPSSRLARDAIAGHWLRVAGRRRRSNGPRTIAGRGRARQSLDEGGRVPPQSLEETRFTLHPSLPSSNRPYRFDGVAQNQPEAAGRPRRSRAGHRARTVCCASGGWHCTGCRQLSAGSTRRSRRGSHSARPSSGRACRSRNSGGR